MYNCPTDPIIVKSKILSMQNLGVKEPMTKNYDAMSSPFQYFDSIETFKKAQKEKSQRN